MALREGGLEANRMSRYLIGIDLGTTHTVVAFTDIAARAPCGGHTRGGHSAQPNIQIFEIEQLVALGEIAARPLLPSLRYHPIPGELSPGDIRLPWTTPAEGTPAGGSLSNSGTNIPDAVLGELARELGTKVPGRLVASAKSWLSHPSVERTAPILPWGGHCVTASHSVTASAGGTPGAEDSAEASRVPSAVEGTSNDLESSQKVSPVEASASYLAHVCDAWNQHFQEFPLQVQDVVLTLPASFDEAARMLTLEAARLAGLTRVHLLEEPQAACYDWLNRHAAELDAALADIRLLLVCDIGGGTTDLSLIKVEHENNGPRLTRIGAGDHLMLGGDNMDLALAHLAEGRMMACGTRLSAASLSQLTQQCRLAKERLLAPNAPERATVTVLGTGAKLIGGARSTELAREEVMRMVLDGFFPQVAPSERPARRQSGIVEFGLPYVADPAVTRHVAAFLWQHANVAREALNECVPEGDALPVPDAVLLNGGVFRSVCLAERLLKVLAAWRGAPLTQLHNDQPELAVARGAVAFGLARRGWQLKIGGGSARSYFLLVEGENAQQRQGVCLLPRSAEEGQEVRLAARSFSLRLGQPVHFHLLSCTGDTAYQPGDVVNIDEETFTPLPPLATLLGSDRCAVAAQPQVTPNHSMTTRQGSSASSRRKTAARYEVPVQLAATLTEVGTLEMSCVSTEAPATRWKLAFQLRRADWCRAATRRHAVTCRRAATAKPEIAIGSGALHPRFDQAAERIERVFGPRARDVGPREVKTLRIDLDKLLGKRESWDTHLLRALYDMLWAGVRHRRRSADHERLWFSLAGYCLRPGFGYPLDDWRVEQLWPLYEQGVQYAREAQVWAEWWTLWRRVAGGLDEAAQKRLLDDVVPELQPSAARSRKPSSGSRNQGYDDMVRLVAGLERLPADVKAELGTRFLKRLRKPGESPQKWWAVGRLGARVPFYGSAHTVVSREVVAKWLEQLLTVNWKAVQPAAFAAALLMRRSGDRARDFDDELRAPVAQRLRAAKAPATWIQMVNEVMQLDEADEQRVFGESLPPGLKLLN